MTTRTARWLTVGFDVIVLALSALMYRRYTLSDLPLYALQIEALATVSGVLSVLFLIDWRRTGMFRVIVFARTLAFSLLTVTVPVLDLSFLPVTLGFILLLALHLTVPAFLAAEAFWLAVVATVSVLFPNANATRSVWGWELQLYGVCVASLVVGALALRWMVRELRAARHLNQLKTEEIERLTSANLGFQKYASLLEQETTKSERLRLSREIHDSAGYALTTLKMLFEAAKGLLLKDPSRLNGLMDEGARISQEALGEIRFVLHELRSKTETLPEGMRLVHLLVSNFEKACGITVQLETTNTRGTYSPRVNATLYRMVQEGMTNAFHHGRATEVSILLAEVDGNLSIRIRDNGTGSATVKKGIGLSGMEERVAEAGGWMNYRTLGNGFEVAALIPLKEEP
jgi:signal transduction histidine kinase